MKKRRRLKKKIKNRLILAFGLLITLFILITLIKGIVGLFSSDNKTMNNEKITEEIKGSETLRKAGMSDEDIKEMTSLLILFSTATGTSSAEYIIIKSC